MKDRISGVRPCLHNFAKFPTCRDEQLPFLYEKSNPAELMRCFWWVVFISIATSFGYTYQEVKTQCHVLEQESLQGTYLMSFEVVQIT